MHKFSLLPLLALLAFTGCRTNPACERQIGLMRSELLALEDKYYLLQEKYEDAVGQDGGTMEGCDALGQPVITPNPPQNINPSRPSDSELRIQIDPNGSSNSFTPRAAPIASEFDTQAAESVVTFQTPKRFAKNQNSRAAAASDNSDESILNLTEGDPPSERNGTSQEPTFSKRAESSPNPPVADGTPQWRPNR